MFCGLDAVIGADCYADARRLSTGRLFFHAFFYLGGRFVYFIAYDKAFSSYISVHRKDLFQAF